MFHIPKNKAGRRAMNTTIIVLFISTASLICDPDVVTLSGTKKRVSTESKAEWNF
jgi:hypothetical protein